MTDSLVVEVPIDPVRWQERARAFGRTVFWFVVVVVALAAVGSCAYALYALSHRASPAGGGG